MTSCIVCRGSWSRHDDIFFHCNACEFSFARELPDQKTLQSFYDDHVDMRWQAAETAQVERTPFRQRTIANCLRKEASVDATVLEVGIGSGELLLALQKQGWSPHRLYGFDLSRSFVVCAQERGFYHVRQAASVAEYLCCLSSAPATFDVVVCSEVLEHLPDPHGAIASIAASLSSGGCVILTVPNRNRALQIGEVWDTPPHHLSRWGIQALTKILMQHGIRVTRSFSYDELGYYVGNLIHNRFEQSRILGTCKNTLTQSLDHAYLPKVLAWIRLWIARLCDIPIYLLLKILRREGHTLVVVGRKI